MDLFPLFFALGRRPVVVVGGGHAATLKVRLLLKAGAALTVVAPKLMPELADLAAEGELRWVRRGFVGGDIGGQVLAVAATGIDWVDRRVAEAAGQGRIPVNVVDRPDLSTFIVPAVVDREGITVAISTGGAAPLLARRVREAIENALPLRLGQLARFAASFRGSVKAAVRNGTARRRLWQWVLDGPIGESVLAGDESEARERMTALVDGRQPPAEGKVYIVGAGPGDPDLLTLRALRLMRQAEVVVYDKLVGPAVVDLVRRDAERIFVGKRRGQPGLDQAGINALLEARARAGQFVVRLKGGDPFIFGRGGEEREHLLQAGIPVEVVPGITAATGCAAAAGIPLTHRDYASALTILTGHGAEGEPDHDWQALARARQTLAVYMGVDQAHAIARRLMFHGTDPAMPVAIVENGTLPNQKIITGTLATLGRMVRDHEIHGPALIVIGKVAALANVAKAQAARTERMALAAG